MEKVPAEENLRRALAAVKRSRRAAGIAGRTTDQLESHLQRYREKIRAKLLVWERAGAKSPSPDPMAGQTPNRWRADRQPDGRQPPRVTSAVIAAPELVCKQVSQCRRT